jgi:hypothetical protein
LVVIFVVAVGVHVVHVGEVLGEHLIIPLGIDEFWIGVIGCGVEWFGELQHVE